MKRCVTWMLTGLAVAAVVSCSNPSEGSQVPSTTPPIPGVSTTTIPPTYQAPYTPPAVVRGATREAAESTAQKFLVGWTTFVPWDFEPADDWFARWDGLASPEFIGQMQTSINSMWSWTWNEQKKAFDSRAEHVVDTWMGDDNRSAVSRVTISRLVLGMNQRVDQIETQTLTFDVHMLLSKSGTPKVVAVTETSADAPPPQVTGAGFGR
ncbi:hypothetical protein [Prescottella subtropica]|uniref:hypothetical protein n=1 Tax=Prescottella subtropica TaxID=2545757 RepID=UPI0010F75FA1|nr:hypothetical protein [Prescottella subtropica]